MSDPKPPGRPPLDPVAEFWRRQDIATVNELQREANYWRSREAELLELAPKSPWYRRWLVALQRLWR